MPAISHRMRLSSDAAFCLRAALISLLVVVLAGQAAMLVPPAWQGGTPAHIAQLHAHAADRFFPFDALWYQRIADDWYAWNPAQPTVQQDVAFFPLWPAVLWVIGRLAAAAGAGLQATHWLTLAVAAAFAVASIRAFHCIAVRLLPPTAARHATWLLALSPAANFFWQSYPTGLMNLLTALAILALMDGRILRAAALSGIVTAAGPLGLGTAIAVCATAATQTLARVTATPQLAATQPTTQLAATGRLSLARAAAGLLGTGLLSVAGLLAFLAWQQFHLHDAFAFMKAQEAWATQLTWPARVPVALLQALVVPDLVAALHALKHTGHPPSLVWLHLAVQKSLYLLLQAAAIVAVAASSRLRCRPVLLQGAATLALFIWFHSASRPGNSTPRLLDCALGIVLGLAWALRNRPVLARIAIAASGCLLAGAEALTVAGYSVT